MAKIIDLRSDTVTEPPVEMRRAMSQADVGDDYYGNDPTVKRLEQYSAELFNKEAGLFVSSGTMGNLVSIMTHCSLGDAVIMEENAHCYHNETGNISSIAGVLPRPLPSDNGVLSSKLIADNITGTEVIHSRTKLICIENTHNVCGGTIWPIEKLQDIWNLAAEKNLLVHMDGARIFNAVVGLGVEPQKLASGADSLTFCLTKGLSCPYGSLIVGDREFIAEARRYRQMTGGGMRQAGIMAAAGIVALESMISRLAEDHHNAQLLAQGLNSLGMDVDLELVQTNMVYATIPSNSNASTQSFASQLSEKNVRINNSPRGRFRFVTHYGITEADISATLNAVDQIINQPR